MKRRNPFPGVTKVFDRHGNPRWRLRKTVKGRKIGKYLPGPYNSLEFRTAYYDAIDPRKSVGKEKNVTPNTFDHVIGDYLSSKSFKSLTASTRNAKRGRLDAIRNQIGQEKLSELEPRHFEHMMDSKGGPDAANRLHKELAEMYRYAQKKLGFRELHPTDQVERRRVRSTSYHTFTADEVQKFRQQHPSGPRARLAFELMLGTGAARQDACAMGRQNIKGPDIWYRRGKTGQDVRLPLNMLPELREE